MAFNFDPNTFVPENNREPLPLGDYWLEVESIAYKETKNGLGKYVACTIDVLAPEDFKGRKVFVNMNVDNQNATAQNIGQQEFGGLCNAIQYKTAFNATDMDAINEQLQEFRLIGFMARLGVDKKDPTAQRVLKWYNPDKDEIPEPKVLEAARPAAANTNTPAAKAEAPKSDKPWAKKAA